MISKSSEPNADNSSDAHRDALRFLADAGKALAAAADADAVALCLAESSVARLGDWCIVYLAEDAGAPRRVAVTAADPARRGLAEDLMRFQAPDIDRIAPFIAGLRAGESMLVNSLPGWMLKALAHGDQHLDAILKLGIRAVMAVPLRSRNRFLGAALFLSAESGRVYTQEDLALAEILSQKSALAIDNHHLRQLAMGDGSGDRGEYLRKEESMQGELDSVVAAMRKIEVRVRRLFEANVIGIIFSGFDGEIFDANDEFLRIVGYSRRELIDGGLGWSGMTPEEHLEISRNAVAQLRELGVCTPFEKEYIRKDGSRVPVLIGAAVLDGSVESAVSFVVDLSQRNQAEAALRESEARNRALLRAIPDLIFRLNGEGVFLDYVAPTDQHLALPSDRFLGRTVGDLFNEEIAERTMAAIARVLETGTLQVFEYTLPIRGRDCHFEARLVPSSEREVLAFVRDVSDRKRAEQELQEAKEIAEAASRAKDQFLAVLSHELRTPLTPVIAAVQAIQEEEVSGELHPFIDIIERNVQLEARLIDDLLDLTRIENGKLQLSMEVADAHMLLQNALEICQSDIAAKALRVVIGLSAVRHHVHGDPARIQQVFWNLIKNAVKFTPTRGAISIESSNTEDGGLRVVVADTGIGIDPDVLPKIFDAFEQGERTITRRFGGMGLGLAISRTLVEMQGGRLTASSPGADLGASFTVELPTIVTDIRRGDEQELSGGVSSGGGTLYILLVDDHRDTSYLLRLLLERHGYAVEIAFDMQGALAAAQRRRFDLLISDIGLPDGSGLELIEKLGDRRPTSAIALSGFGMEEDVRRSHEAGFDEHLIKPVSFEKLRAVIEKLGGRGEL